MEVALGGTLQLAAQAPHSADTPLTFSWQADAGVLSAPDAESTEYICQEAGPQAIRIAGRRFTTRRMLQDYGTMYYAPILLGEPFTDDPPLG